MKGMKWIMSHYFDPISRIYEEWLVSHKGGDEREESMRGIVFST